MTRQTHRARKADEADDELEQEARHRSISGEEEQHSRACELRSPEVRDFLGKSDEIVVDVEHWYCALARVYREKCDRTLSKDAPIAAMAQ